MSLVTKEFIINSVTIDKNDCWRWTKYVGKKGYGIFPVKGKNRKAHRLSYEAFVGEIPKNKVVCHKCDVRDCVNPEHLFIGTIYENNKDMKAKGRAAKGDTHPWAKLSYVIAVEIIERCSKNFGSPDALASEAKRYGVADTVIRNILNGERWVNAETAKARKDFLNNKRWLIPGGRYK